MLLRRVGRSIKYAFTDSNISIEGLALAAGGSLSDGRAKFPPIALQSGANLQNQLEWLGEKIVGPLFANVDVRSVSRVVLVTPGAFKDIPWHAVPLSPRTATLGDVADVVEAPSSAILMHLTKRPPSKLRRAVLVACDPYRQLTDHVREIQDAFAALDAQERIILTDVSRPVTLAAVVAELRDADVFHFAGHGVGSMGDPHRSGLALSDGVLSAEVIERTLAGRAPNMVLLSACRTATSGFADTSHVPNLLGALIGAGSRVAVGALWDVPDQAASRMMGEIYRLLPSHGLARAVCEARRALRRAAVSPTAIPGRAGAEFAWAAFDVMGWD
jgi:CHAT domain-containing protein